MNHTSGPWKIVREVKDEDGLKLWIGPTNKDFHSIAIVRNGANDREYGGEKRLRLNAELIASAPELLEALKAIVEDSATRSGRAYDIPTQQSVDVALRIIARAEGRTP